MAASDYVVVATPYTPQTDKLVNAAAIAAMKPTGVLVNVGRGKCVDEEALIDGEPMNACKATVLPIPMALCLAIRLFACVLCWRAAAPDCI